MAILIAIVSLVNLTPVQELLAHKATDMLSAKLKTKVTVAHVRIDFLNHFLLQGLYIEGQAHDTLLYAGEAQIRISDWFIFKKTPVLHYIALQDAYIHLYRTGFSNVWNYDFLSDAFSGGKNDTSAGKPVAFNLQKIALGNIRFYMDDQWGGEDIDIDVASAHINANDLDFKKKLLDLNNIDFENAFVNVRDYPAGKPKRLHNAAADTVDTTPFNPGMWHVKSAALSLTDCRFALTSDTLEPLPGLFDQDHLDITRIAVKVSTISIAGDTVRGHVDHLFAQERCGLAVRDMQSDVSVSPVASVCRNLYLETGYSKIRNYYAMQYKRFPDFLNYIDSVVMVGHLDNAVIDERDIAYFAPQLKKFPPVVLRASGDGKGTVADLAAQHMNITDGNNILKGNATMKGLPDIYKTWITFSDGELFTTNAGITRYAPGLKNNPDIALEHLTYALFRGNYTGYIENFAVDGTLNTNLGNVNAHIKLNIPGFNSNSAIYSGSIATDNLQLGILLKQPLLGGITLKENISGISFNPGEGKLGVDGTISEITLKGYTYHNIITHGTLLKKQFDGTLLVDDPNLALEFDGGINFNNKNINVKATAHLLGSNFKAMNLTTDSITASADFDLNCTGSNIDNFSGYAKLNNISMKRNSHRLAFDSVLVNASDDSGGHKLLTVNSNVVTAEIKGAYLLSKLPGVYTILLIPVPAKLY